MTNSRELFEPLVAAEACAGIVGETMVDSPANPAAGGVTAHADGPRQAIRPWILWV